LYFHSLAKSGTIRTVEEEFNLVTAKLGQVFKCQKFIISDKDFSEQGLIAKSMFRRWRSLKVEGYMVGRNEVTYVQKMDDQQSNCCTSVKKGLLGK